MTHTTNCLRSPFLDVKYYDQAPIAKNSNLDYISRDGLVNCDLCSFANETDSLDSILYSRSSQIIRSSQIEFDQKSFSSTSSISSLGSNSVYSCSTFSELYELMEDIDDLRTLDSKSLKKECLESSIVSSETGSMTINSTSSTPSLMDAGKIPAFDLSLTSLQYKANQLLLKWETTRDGDDELIRDDEELVRDAYDDLVRDADDEWVADPNSPSKNLGKDSHFSSSEKYQFKNKATLQHDEKNYEQLTDLTLSVDEYQNILNNKCNPNRKYKLTLCMLREKFRIELKRHLLRTDASSYMNQYGTEQEEKDISVIII